MSLDNVLDEGTHPKTSPLMSVQKKMGFFLLLSEISPVLGGPCHDDSIFFHVMSPPTPLQPDSALPPLPPRPPPSTRSPSPDHSSRPPPTPGSSSSSSSSGGAAAGCRGGSAGRSPSRSLTRAPRGWTR